MSTASSGAVVLVCGLLLFFTGESRVGASPNILCVVWSSLLQEMEPGAAINGFSASALDDAGPCTHLLFLSQRVQNALESEIRNETTSVEEEAEAATEASTAYLRRGEELRRQRPELKLILNMDIYAGLVERVELRRKAIDDTVEFLKRHNMDGVLLQCQANDFAASEMRNACVQLTTEICAELHKNNLTLSLFLWNGKKNPYSEEELSAMAGCSEFIVMETNCWPYVRINTTELVNPLLTENSTLDWYIGQGIPREKLTVVFTLTAHTYRLKNPKDGEVGAEVAGPGLERLAPFGPGQLYSFQMMRKLRNPEEGWVIRRDELTDTPYAVNSEGIWATYEDETSFRTKGRYLRNYGIGNAVVMAMDLDDHRGVEGGAGRFPMIKALRDSLLSDD